MGIVHGLEPITLIGGGEVRECELRACLELAPRLVAADGGAHKALDLGEMPEVVIGDMDSGVGLLERGVATENVHRIAEQNSTDFDKALRNIDCPLVLGVGFMGQRIDHELACYNALVRQPERRCILVGAEDIVCLCPPSLALDLQEGTRVSLFPMAECQGRSSGLQWPLDGITFSSAGQIGTSNAAIGAVQIEMQGPGMLLILPRDCLGVLAMALLEQPGSWPAL